MPYSQGDRVKIIHGWFTGQFGTVDRTDQDQTVWVVRDTQTEPDPFSESDLVPAGRGVARAAAVPAAGKAVTITAGPFKGRNGIVHGLPVLWVKVDGRDEPTPVSLDQVKPHRGGRGKKDGK